MGGAGPRHRNNKNGPISSINPITGQTYACNVIARSISLLTALLSFLETTRRCIKGALRQAKLAEGNGRDELAFGCPS
jgi:hypothetical protein